MSDTAVAGEETVKRTRTRAEFVDIDFDEIPALTRVGRSSELKRRVEKVREDNTGKPRLIAKYRSAASASSAATAQRKAFATQGFKFAVRELDDEATGLFVTWNEGWVGLDDAPKPRNRKPKAEAVATEPTPEAVANAEKATDARRGRR